MLTIPPLVSRALVAAAAAPLLAAGCSSSSSGGGPHAIPAAASETFHNVSPAANHVIQRSLALMPGVASVVYQDSDLVVRFKSTAVKADQTNVENVVRQDQEQASASASPWAKPSRKK